MSVNAYFAPPAAAIASVKADRVPFAETTVSLLLADVASYTVAPATLSGGLPSSFVGPLSSCTSCTKIRSGDFR